MPMRQQYSFILFLLLLLLTACEHSISYDYPSLEGQLLNIEGRVTNEGAFVRITQTQPMIASPQYQAIANANVWIEKDNGTIEKFHYIDSCMMYLPEKEFTGEPGHTYTLHVIANGQTYEGQSTMPPPAPVTETRFRWLDIRYERILHYDLTAIDPQPDTLNYYWYRVTVGSGYFVTSSEYNHRGRHLSEVPAFII